MRGVELFYPHRVARSVLLYGVCGGLLVVALRLVEYRFLVIEHSIEIYGALIASVFAGLGIWLGLTLTRTREVNGRINAIVVPMFEEAQARVKAGLPSGPFTGAARPSGGPIARGAGFAAGAGACANTTPARRAGCAIPLSVWERVRVRAERCRAVVSEIGVTESLVRRSRVPRSTAPRCAAPTRALPQRGRRKRAACGRAGRAECLELRTQIDRAFPRPRPAPANRAGALRAALEPRHGLANGTAVWGLEPGRARRRARTPRDGAGSARTGAARHRQTLAGGTPRAGCRC